MSEHTKGPWLARTTGDEHGSWFEVVAMDGGPFDSATGVCETYLEADARLIAHAPELLAALTACVKAWEVNGNAEIPLREARALLNRMGDDA